MCAAMFARAISWHAILAAAPTWRRAKRRDAMQGTFIGVLMSATLPARLGEPSRALITARRLGRARETLPVVLGTMVSQTLLNLLALSVPRRRHPLARQRARRPRPRPDAARPDAAGGAARGARGAGADAARRRVALRGGCRPRSPACGAALLRLRRGCSVFRHPRAATLATLAQLAAWALQWLSCWLLLMALGIDDRAGAGAAAAVLFAVNVTAVIPATPANVGVFQAACVAVLAGAYHVSTPEAIAFGIVLQAVELATALLMGLPALLNEGLSWREVRLRTMHATPRAPAAARAAAARRRGGAAAGGE